MNTTPRIRMRPEERRQQILNVALDLFAQRGFEEVLPLDQRHIGCYF